MKHNKLMLMLLAGSMILGNCGTILHAEETEEQFCMITEESGSDLTEADMEEPAEDESVLYAADLIEDDSALYAGDPIDDDIQLQGAASYWVDFDYINSTWEVLTGESATVKAAGSREGDAFVKITDVRTPDGVSIPASERERLFHAEVSGNSLTVSTNYVPDIPEYNIYVCAILTVNGIQEASTLGRDEYIRVRSSVMGIELAEYPQTDELPLVAGREYILTPHLMRGIEGFSTPANYLFRVTSNDTGALEVSTDAEPYDASYIMINGVKTKADGQLYRGGTGFTVKRTSNTVLYNAQTQLTLTVTAYKHVAEEEAWAPDKSRDYHFVEMFGDLNFSDSIDITKDSRNSTFIDEERFNRFRETLGDEYANISYNITTGEYVHDLFVPDTTVDINGLFSYDPSQGELRATGTAGQLKGVAGDNDGFHVMVTGYLYGEKIMVSGGYVWIDVTADIEDPPAPGPSDPEPESETISVSKKPSLSKPKVNSKSKATIAWKKFKQTKKTKPVWKKIKKIEVQYSTDSSFRTNVTKKKIGKSKTKLVLKGLQKNTTYYVRIRYFDGGNGYSGWSGTKKFRTKKK